MEELIWFSIPGAVLAISVVLVWPTVIETPTNAILLATLVPVIGFIIHEFYRLIFELSGGFARKSRLVLHGIILLANHVDVPLSNLKQAHLIWVLTFYSDDFPKAFRDHGRGTWHYIFSFWSICVSAIISLPICVYGLMNNPQEKRMICGVLLQIII